MKISLEDWLRNKLDVNEGMRNYAVTPNTLRRWIDEYNQLKSCSLNEMRDMDDFGNRMGMTNEIMKVFRQHKLGQSLFNSYFRLDKETLHNAKLSQEDLIRIAKSELTKNLADYIMNHYEHTIEETDLGMSIEFRTQLLVLELSNFKTIVEAAIELMPIEAINKIKNGEIL